MVRAFLASAVAIVVAMAGSASAADLPMAAKAPAPPPPPASYSWTGFYIGGNVGGGWALGNATGSIAGTVSGVTFAGSEVSSANLSGALGGGQLGYNWQTGSLVFGLEGDIDASGISASASTGCGVAVAGCSMSGTPKVSSFGTVRGRVGYAVDKWLFYATGGYGWQDISNTIIDTVAGVGSATLFSTSTTRGGYAVGTGIELALGGHWTAGLEYLYLDTGTFTLASGAVPTSVLTLFGAHGGATATYTDVVRLQNDVVRLRVNYRF
jgi:outer membrane immunogenic protein